MATDGADRSDGAVQSDAADGGTDAPRTAIGAFCGGDNRLMELTELTELSGVMDLTVAVTLHALPLLLSV